MISIDMNYDETIKKALEEGNLDRYFRLNSERETPPEPAVHSSIKEMSDADIHSFVDNIMAGKRNFEPEEEVEEIAQAQNSFLSKSNLLFLFFLALLFTALGLGIYFYIR